LFQHQFRPEAYNSASIGQDKDLDWSATMSASEMNEHGRTQGRPEQTNPDQPSSPDPVVLWSPEAPDQAEPPAAETAWGGLDSQSDSSGLNPLWAGPGHAARSIDPDRVWAPPPPQPTQPTQAGSNQPRAAEYSLPPAAQSYYQAFQTPPPPPDNYPPYQQWATTPGTPAPAAPRPDGVGRRLAPLIVGVALLSASLSAVGTYAAISLTTRSSIGATAVSGQTATTQQITLTQSDAIVRVANLVKPSVVTITSQETAGLSPFSVPATGVGSGFIVSSSGLILTNNHVVSGSTSLTVVLDDTRSLSASVVSTDPKHDLALIKVSATGLTAVTLGDSSSVQVGQLAVAIGSPLGTFTDSVTQGIVSGVNRTITVADQATRSQEDLSGLIQTDAAINPGNSGGPLLDASGSVVGIITASSSDAQNMGFAIPINQAKAMIMAAGK
jgi:serine protease Do